MWRALARRADDVAGLLVRTDLRTSEYAALGGHLAKSFNAHLSLARSSQSHQKDEVHRWATARGHAAHSGMQIWITSLAKTADAKAKRLEATIATSKRAAWRVAIGALAEDGATRVATPTKLAYRWGRGFVKWTPASVGSIALNDAVPQPPDDKDDTDQLLYVEHQGLMTTAADATRVPLCDQAHIDQTAGGWATPWQEKDMYIEPKFEVDAPQFKQLLPWAILRACESSPLNTGLGGDNISPRAFLRLSSEALEALAVLFMLFESICTWEDVFELVMIVLLPKSDGGRRPIGLLFTTVRLWMRARIYENRFR